MYYQKLGLVLKHTQLPIQCVPSVQPCPEHEGNHIFPFSAWQNKEWSSVCTLLCCYGVNREGFTSVI